MQLVSSYHHGDELTDIHAAHWRMEVIKTELWPSDAPKEGLLPPSTHFGPFISVLCTCQNSLILTEILLTLVVPSLPLPRSRNFTALSAWMWAQSCNRYIWIWHRFTTCSERTPGTEFGFGRGSKGIPFGARGHQCSIHTLLPPFISPVS